MASGGLTPRRSPVCSCLIFPDRPRVAIRSDLDGDLETEDVLLDAVEHIPPMTSGVIAHGSTVGHHLATFTSRVTVFVPPEFLTSSLNFPSFVGLNFTEHFGPGLVSLPISLPSWS
jgi:hypothetical protein